MIFGGDEKTNLPVFFNVGSVYIDMKLQLLLFQDPGSVSPSRVLWLFYMSVWGTPLLSFEVTFTEFRYHKKNLKST